MDWNSLNFWHLDLRECPKSASCVEMKSSIPFIQIVLWDEMCIDICRIPSPSLRSDPIILSRVGRMCYCSLFRQVLLYSTNIWGSFVNISRNPLFRSWIHLPFEHLLQEFGTQIHYYTVFGWLGLSVSHERKVMAWGYTELRLANVYIIHVVF